jgi:hypothetical protein
MKLRTKSKKRGHFTPFLQRAIFDDLKMELDSVSERKTGPLKIVDFQVPNLFFDAIKYTFETKYSGI